MSKQSDLVSVSQGASGDPLFIDTTNDRVGVGTSSPTAKLDVSGAGFNGGKGRFVSTNSGNSVDIVGVNAAGVNDTAYVFLLDQVHNAFIGLTGPAAGAGALRFAVGGAERMRIDSAGRITMPYQPAFSAYRTAGNIGTGSNQLYNFNVAVLNVGSHYNTSNGRFTAPVSGHYMFTYHMLKRQGGVAATYLKKNGGNTISSANTYTDNGSATQEQTVGASHIIYLAASDYVEVRVDVTSGDIYGDTNSHNIFTGHLIG